jgi:hypothetical protein
MKIALGLLIVSFVALLVLRTSVDRLLSGDER